MGYLLSLLFAAYFFGSSAVGLIISAFVTRITAPFDERRRLTHAWSSYWGYHYLQINPGWKVTFEGRDNLDEKKTYVLVANHQSMTDILVLYGLHKSFKFVSKESIMNVPFIGKNMNLNQYVLIKRGDLKSIKEMMQTCRDWLNKRTSVVIFPEGTRSEDGEIQAFRDGAFRLAMDCHVDVIPIVIDGTFEILPKKARALNFKQHINVKVLPPVSCAPFENSSGRMRNYVHDLMVETLAEMRGRTPEPH